jgi:hypothetical protein
VHGSEKLDLTSITRSGPTYSFEQLTEVVLAVDEVVHG